MNSQPDSEQPQQLHTGGGAAITGDVHTGGGDFVGRDFIQNIRDHVAITGDGNIVGDGNAVIQHRGDVYLIQIGEWVGRLTPQTLHRILTSALSGDEPLQVYANPYRGLKPFTAEDAGFFFGRDALIAEMVAQLRRAPRFLAVVGPSGSGKSSVVQAGLLPALRRGDLPGSQDWQIVTARPGADPYVAVDLSGLRSPDKSARTVLFLDQFEELFALCAPEVQTRFLDELHALMTGATPLTVILTLRADFYGHLQRSPLGVLLKHALVDVLPLTPTELRAAVEEPARRVGLDFEAGLVERIVADARQAEHALPLLQSALAQVAHRQENGRLTYAAYQAVGGVAGALGLWAEDAYTALTADEQILAQRIFTRLVHFHAGEGADTRQRQSLAVLAARPEEHDAAHRLVRRLADARLLVTAEHEGEQTVEIIHDALLREWARLADWLMEQREFYLWRQRLDGQLQTWEAQGCDESALLRGALLAEAEAWAASHNTDLNTPERRFIEASLALREQERATRERRRRRLTLATVGAAVVFLVLALLAWGQRNIALDAQATAEAEARYRATAQAQAETERERAERQAQIALARQLAAQSQYMLDHSPAQLARAVLLAVESVQRYPESLAHQVIAEGFALLPHEIAQMAHREGAPVNVVAFSQDGQWVVSGGADGTARVWEATTGTEVARMTHEHWVSTVIFSPDGRLVVSGSGDNTARVWEAATGDEVARMTHEETVSTVAFSPDGQWVISGSADGTARVWEATTGVEVARMLHGEEVYAVAFSPDGQWVISGSADGTARVWETAAGREAARMMHDAAVNAVDFSPDGQWVVSGSADGTARVWEATTGTEVARMTHEHWVSTVIFSPDGRLVVSGSWDNTARVWEAATGDEVARITHSGAVTAVALSPDGRWIVSGSWDRTTRVWEAATGREVARITYDGKWYEAVFDVAFSPNGQQVISCNISNVVRLWDISINLSSELKTGAEIVRQTHGRKVNAVAFSPDGRWVVSSSDDYSMQVWEAATGREVAQITHEQRVNAVAFSPDGKWIVSGSNDKTVRIWEVTTGAEIARLTHAGYVSAVAFSTDGQWVVSGSRDRTARVWEVATGNEVARITHEEAVMAVAFSPDGQQVISGSGDSVWLWEVLLSPNTGVVTETKITQTKHGETVYAIAFSPDGRLVVSAGCNEHKLTCLSGSAQVWEVATGIKIAQVMHDGIVYAVDFSPDGRWVVSGGEDNTVRVWEAVTGREIARMTHDGPVLDVAFSPDGRWIASASEDGTVRVWWWHPDDMIRLACSRLTRNLTREEWNEYIGPDIPYRATCPNLPVPEE